MRGTGWVAFAIALSGCKTHANGTPAPAVSVSAASAGAARPIAVPSANPIVSASLGPKLTLAVPAPDDSSRPPVGPMISVESVKYDAQVEEAFAARLFRNARLAPGVNAALSPASLRLALGMVYMGARTSTAKEMSKALEFSPDAGRTAGILSDSVRDWTRGQWENIANEVRPPNVHVVNRVWGQRDHRFLRGFLDSLSGGFEAPLATLDFAKEPEVARGVIDAWVDSAAGHHLREFVPPGVLASNTRLVLTSAVYVAERWATSFDSQHSSAAPFHAPEGDVSAQFMHLTHDFAFAELDNVKALKLPYEAHDWSMIVLLPNERGRLSQLERTLDDHLIQRVMAALTSQEPVRVSLPRFKIDFAARLDDAFERLGMSSAFSSSADFSGMDGTRQLYLSAVLQRVTMNVDEGGAVASPATAGSVPPKGAPALPREFRADHPFLVLICDRRGRVVLLARIVDPTR